MKMPELPKPYSPGVAGWVAGSNNTMPDIEYTAEQMRAYGEAVREACAKVCDNISAERDQNAAGAEFCAAAIRSDQD